MLPHQAPVSSHRDALYLVTESMDLLDQTYRLWTTRAPGYSKGPSFRLDLDSATPPSTNSLRLSAETISRILCPISGPRWKEMREAALKDHPPLKGLKSDRGSAEAELNALEKFAQRIGSWDESLPSSNAPHLISNWEEVIYLAHVSGPLEGLYHQQLLTSPEGTLPRGPATNRKVIGAQSRNKRAFRVDIVSKGGKKWTKMYNVRPDRLRSEFREAESYMVDHSSDEDELSNKNDPVTSHPSHRHGSSRLDLASDTCSLMETARDLIAAARSAERELALMRQKVGLPGDEKIELELVVTRCRLPGDGRPVLTREQMSDTSFLELDEQTRMDERVKAIVREIERLGIVVVAGYRTLPDIVTGGRIKPSLSLVALESGPPSLPTIPPPPQESSWKATSRLNLDASCLVALISETSHSDFGLVSFDDEALENCFRTMSLKEEARRLRDQERSVDQEPDINDVKISIPDPRQKTATQSGSGERRALVDQLRREFRHEAFIKSFFELAVGACSEFGETPEPIQLYVQKSTLERFERLVSLIAGPNEKRRASALLGKGGVPPEDFWVSSRWCKKGSEIDLLRQAVSLPVKLLPDLGPGIPQGMAELYPDITSRHFASQAIETLESCLRSVWGPDWDEFEEKLPDKWSKKSQKLLRAPKLADQSYSTLLSTLAGLKVGMTTVTCNSESITWLLKTMKQYPPSPMVQSLQDELDAKMSQDPIDFGQTFRASFWLFHPRSLSEQMRTTTAAPPWQSVLKDCDADNEACTIGLPILGRDAAGLLSSDGSDYRPSFGNRLTNSSESGHLRPQLRDKAIMRRIMNRALHWIAGPRPPSRMTVKHYRWWPFSRAEATWSQITHKIAWKDPQRSRRRGSISANPTSRAGSDHRSEDFDGPESDPDGLLPEHQGFRSRKKDSLWQHATRRDWGLNRLHWLILFVAYVAWVLGFSFLVSSLWYDSKVTSEDGVTSSPVFFGCTSTYWLRNGLCGLNGQDCEPFSMNKSMTFRCPSDCQGTTLLNPRTVGREQINYVPLVVGGADAQGTFRSDSFICASAIHAGIFQASKGGCGSLSLVGAYTNYQASLSNELESVPFDSAFPSSFRLAHLETAHDCTDRRIDVYILNVIMTAAIGFFLRPKRIVWFWTLACVGFWHINMVSEPRDFPPPVGEAIGDFLPFLFVSYTIYRLSFRSIWLAFENFPIEREVWTLAFWWIGIMMNAVFAKVPIQRLVAHDIRQQPGSMTALIIIAIVVLIIAVNQFRVIRSVGKLPKYLFWYLIGATLVGLAACVPGETLRLHHYIIALVLLPACAFPTRLSLIYASFLYGMFTNGVARWGFDGLLEDNAVVQGDATGGTGIPSFLTNPTTWKGAGSFGDGIVRWKPIPEDQKASWDSFSLLIDDVLRFQGEGTSFNLTTLPDQFHSNSGSVDASTSAALNSSMMDGPHYLRLAYSRNGSPGDYTKAAIAFFNGTWIDAPPGRT
ncbi:hypothetical protein IE53DRAFT_380015 [Violaceomyces palustris]|uniref:Uncharacterized protein n=1 Tax=Violaceomyces palustris TaxID=1673888 RepID=A0ACD0NWB9_9BASI|nr:hypothetical protein IE53DRAFT_380015 [Violaceomyces palustris]